MGRLNKLIIGQTQGFEDSSFVFLACIRGSDGELITQADLTSITPQVTDVTNNGETSAKTALTISGVILDTPDTDHPIWLDEFPGDTIGYNFIFEAPASWFPAAAEYAVEFIFVPTSGAEYQFPVVYKHITKNLRSS